MTVIKRKPRRTYRVQMQIRFDDRPAIVRSTDIVAANMKALQEKIDDDEALDEMFDAVSIQDDPDVIDHVTGMWISMEEVARVPRPPR